MIFTSSMAIDYDNKVFKNMYQARKTLKQNGFILTKSAWSTVDLTLNIPNFREYKKDNIRLLLIERIGKCTI